jgi:hypothetical protein
MARICERTGAPGKAGAAMAEREKLLRDDELDYRGRFPRFDVHTV